MATTRERTGNLFALYRRAKKREKGGKKREREGKKKEVEKHNRGTTNEAVYSGQKFRIDLLLF